jgi:beta-lactamase class C
LSFQACSETKSGTTEKQPITKLPAYINSFEDSLRSKISREKIPGAALAIIQDSTIRYLQTFGYIENGSGRAVDSNTVFRLGSLSKGFTAVLTGILVEEGRLHWNDKIIKHYPEFALKDSAQTRRVEIRHLLSHSSGLPYHAYTNLIEDGLTLEKIIPNLAKLDLIAKEGEIYAYQNAAFAIMEKVIEAVCDTKFEAVLKNKIFDALLMNNASTSYESLISSGNFAKPHFFSAQEQDYISIPNSKKYYNAVSAGGVNVSISDMAKWMKLLTGSRPNIIADSTLDYIFNPLIKVNTRRYSRRWKARRSEYAMGWRIVNFEGRPIAFHGGYVNAYRSEIAIDRTNKLAICVLFNSPHWYSSRIIPEFFRNFFIADTTSEDKAKLVKEF